MRVCSGSAARLRQARLRQEEAPFLPQGRLPRRASRWRKAEARRRASPARNMRCQQKWPELRPPTCRHQARMSPWGRRTRRQ